MAINDPWRPLPLDVNRLDRPEDDTHVLLQRAEQISDVMAALLGAGSRLNPSCHVAFLAHDQATSAWHLTSMLGPRSRPVDLHRLGLPTGPIAFTPPPEGIALPLAEVMQGVWDERQCALLMEQRGVQSAIAATAWDGGNPLGTVLLLLDGPAGAQTLTAALCHAATAVGRVLPREVISAAGGLLDPATFVERATSEVERARRYRREVTVLVIECDQVAQLSTVSITLVGLLRRWDIIGRLDSGQLAIGMLLPEMTRDGVSGLLHRLSEELSDLFVGAAVFPGDGDGFAQLAATALGRARQGKFDLNRGARSAPGGVLWVRGAPAGAGLDAVRCPGCLTGYQRATRGNITDRQLADERLEVSAILQAECPRHTARVATVDELSNRPVYGGKLRLFGRQGGKGR